MNPPITETGEVQQVGAAPKAPPAAGPLDPTLTVPRAALGAVDKLPPHSVPTHEALRDRLQRAAQLARQNKAAEALGEFEAVYTNYLTLGDPALAIIGAKAAFNRGVLLEKLLGDSARAELAFEKLFGNFGQFEAAEIRAVVARSGLHAARLAAVNQHLDVAVQRYGDRLGPYGEYLPPLELRGFISDYRRLRTEMRARAQGIVPPSGLPEIVAEHEIYSLTPPRTERAAPPTAPALNFTPALPVAEASAPAPHRALTVPAAVAPAAASAGDMAGDMAGLSAETSAAASAGPAIVTAPASPASSSSLAPVGAPPGRDDPAPLAAGSPVASPAAPVLPVVPVVPVAAPKSGEGGAKGTDPLSRTGASRQIAANVVEFPLSEIARAAEANAQSGLKEARTATRAEALEAQLAALGFAAAKAPAGLSRDEMRAMLDALDRRMAAYVADVRGEVGSLGSALAGLNAAMSNVQSQHLQLRNELQTQEGVHTQNLNARFHEMREDMRDSLADVRSELRTLATEQRHARALIVAVVLVAAAAVIAVTLAF